MRVSTLFLGALFIASPAFALSESAIEYCLSTPNPKACLVAVSADVNQRRMEAAQQRQIDAQLEQARIQANGLALFGAGNAFVNGMNQGLHQMHQPYVNTPQYQYTK